MTADLERAVGRIEGKIDFLIAKQNEASERIKAAEDRLYKIEQNQARRSGMIAAYSTVGGLLAWLITTFGQKFFGT